MHKCFDPLALGWNGAMASLTRYHLGESPTLEAVGVEELSRNYAVPFFYSLNPNPNDELLVFLGSTLKDGIHDTHNNV